MSEYQYIEFRAVDRALTDSEWKFANKQSTRAHITRRSFQNEYHYGDFNGDVNGLLRRGYDVFMHYANFGIRKAAFRLPAGTPCSKTLWSKYIDTEAIKWSKDRKGKAGILTLSPCTEPGDLEQIWEPGEYMDEFVEVRRCLVAGDLRALYVLWLCAATDEYVSLQITEPPVPGGLSQCEQVFGPFLEFFGIDPLILLAASEGAPGEPERPTLEQLRREWIEKLSEKEAKLLLHRFLAEDVDAIKTEVIASIQQIGGPLVWPTVSLGRTAEMLLERTEQIRAECNAQLKKKQEAAAKREAVKKERARKKRMQEMVKEPTTWLHRATKLVEARGTVNYKAAAELLADLREAVGGDEGDKITRKHAAHLAKKHPTLTHLKSSLRKRDLLE